MLKIRKGKSLLTKLVLIFILFTLYFIVWVIEFYKVEIKNNNNRDKSLHANLT